jgi:hypothetical protein
MNRYVITELVLERKGHCVSRVTIKVKYVTSEVLMVVIMMNTIFWDVTLLSPVEVYQQFRGMYCLHCQGG